MSAAWYDEALTLIAPDSGASHSATLSWLVFRGHRAHVLIPCALSGPLGVIRRWNEASAATHEIAMLERLQGEEAAPTLATLPRPLGSFRSGESLVSAQSWLHGSPMRARSGSKWRDSAIGYLAAFRRWLALRLPGRPLLPLVPNHATDVLMRRITRRTPTGPARRELQQFLAGLDETVQAEHGVLHNDLNLGNLLVDQAGNISGVLDWEHAGLGPLLCDWIGFVNQLALALSDGNRHALPNVQAALELAWLGSGWLQRAVREETQRLFSSSRAPAQAKIACWRLATFRVAYASVRDEGPAAQTAIGKWLTIPAPEFIAD